MRIYVIYKKSHALNEIILFGFLYFWELLWHGKLTFSKRWMDFLSNFVFLVTRKLHFLTRCLYFHYWWREIGKKINSSTIFEECYISLSLRRKICGNSWLLITWILKKLNSIKTLVEYILEMKASHLLSKTYKKLHAKTNYQLGVDNERNVKLEKLYRFVTRQYWMN